MNNRLTIIAVVVLGIGMIIFSYLYLEWSKNLTDDFQSLNFAIGASIFGIIFHFAKNHQSITKSNKMSMESIELLLLMMSPAFVTLNILKDVETESRILIILPIIIVIFLWYIITLIRTTKPADAEEGKPAFNSAHLIYGSMIAMVIPIIWILLLF